MAILDTIGSLFSGSSSSSGGSALGYSGQNSSAIGGGDSVKVGGGIGAQNFNLGTLGIGNTQSSIPTWAWYVVAGLVIFIVVKKFR